MLEARGLTKRYGGLLALDQVSFQLQRGEIVGYLGPNGSGKSTTVNIVVGLLEPSAGTIALDGRTLSEDPIAYKQKIGYVPEEPYLYTHLTATEYLTLVGRLRGIRQAVLEHRIARLLTLFQLHDSRYSTMAAYSKGMRQRVLLAAALMHNPDLLVLDEPFSGLDVNAGLLFRALLALLAADRRMILFSTHRFDMVEKLCSRVVILSSGRLVAEHEMADAARRRIADARRDVLPRDQAGGLHARRQGDRRHHRRDHERDPWIGGTSSPPCSTSAFCREAGSDAFRRVLIGIIAVLLTFGLLLARMYSIGPTARSVDAYPARERRRRGADDRRADAGGRLRHAARQPLAVPGRNRLSRAAGAADVEADCLPVEARWRWRCSPGCSSSRRRSRCCRSPCDSSAGRFAQGSFTGRIAAHLAASASASMFVVLALTGDQRRPPARRAARAPARGVDRLPQPHALRAGAVRAAGGPASSDCRR